MWSPCCFRLIILQHTPLCVALNLIIRKSPSLRQVSNTILFSPCGFSRLPRLDERILDIKKFEKPLIPQPSYSHTADLITHSVWNDILKEPALWQVALCHHYSSVTPTQSRSLCCCCCSWQLCTYKKARVLERTYKHTRAGLFKSTRRVCGWGPNQWSN